MVRVERGSEPRRGFSRTVSGRGSCVYLRALCSLSQRVFHGSLDEEKSFPEMLEVRLRRVSILVMEVSISSYLCLVTSVRVGPCTGRIEGWTRPFRFGLRTSGESTIVARVQLKSYRRQPPCQK